MTVLWILLAMFIFWWATKFGRGTLDTVVTNTPAGTADILKETMIRRLLRQAARWSTAAQQDANAMVAVLHANYGVGYLGALEEIATHAEIVQVIGTQWDAIRAEIIRTQDTATRRTITQCPEFGPKRTLLTAIAGEGV